MSDEAEIADFERLHPHPDEVSYYSLFRFSSLSQPKKYLEQLFLDGLLYHPLPYQLNDPFEAKPVFRWPNNPQKVREIRKHLYEVAKNEGHSKKSAQNIVAQGFRTNGFMRAAITEATRNTFATNRICSFTGSKGNLLFWAHYADSHRGFCVEYDASILPIRYAFKVQYSKEYPEAVYPPKPDKRMLKPLLIKSNEWEYEEEFRIILNLSANNQPPNNGQSIILSGPEIKNIYFGALAEDSDKNKLIDLLEKGPFKPRIWQAELSDSEFSLDFKCLSDG